MRTFFASVAMFAVAVLTAGATASDVPHYRASHENGGIHFRASHGHDHQSRVVFSSVCRGPVVVTTWQPSHRLYRSGFTHFSRPTIVAQPPIVFSSSRGYRSALGGFVHVQPGFGQRGSVCSYNGSVGSNLAHQRRINWDRRAKVHSPKLSGCDD